jgi:hypothetical protein
MRFPDPQRGSTDSAARRRSHAYDAAVALRIIGEIMAVRTIAIGRRIRELSRLNRFHGRGRWRKRKGIALVELPDGSVEHAELQWYEAHGIGRREFKIKRLLAERHHDET